MKKLYHLGLILLLFLTITLAGCGGGGNGNSDGRNPGGDTSSNQVYVGTSHLGTYFSITVMDQVLKYTIMIILQFLNQFHFKKRMLPGLIMVFQTFIKQTFLTKKIIFIDLRLSIKLRWSYKYIKRRELPLVLQ